MYRDGKPGAAPQIPMKLLPVSLGEDEEPGPVEVVPAPSARRCSHANQVDSWLWIAKRSIPSLRLRKRQYRVPKTARGA